LPLVIINNYLYLLKNVWKAVLLQSALFIFCYIIFYKKFSQEIIEILCSLSRPVIFYWFVYISLGKNFQKKLPSLIKKSEGLSLRIKLTLVILTSFTMVIENTYVHSLIQDNCFHSNFEYVRCSYIFSVIIMFLCFASIKEDSLPLDCRKIVYIFSKYSLGIFCINGIISKFLLPNIIRQLIKTPIADLSTALLIKIIVFPLLLLVSLTLSIVLSKVGLRKCVC
jgi:hypothetical protein